MLILSKENKMKTKKRAISVVLTLAVVFAVSALTAMQVQDVKNGPDFADPSMNYAMGEEVKLGTNNRGAQINQKALDGIAGAYYPDEQTIKLADDVYVMTGEVLNAAFVVGPEGVLVFDAGENPHDGKRYKQEIRKITDKPIKAIMYSHSHYVHGAKYIAEGEKDVMVIGHPNINKNMTGGGIGGRFHELQPLQWNRGLQQVQMLLPKEGKDSQVGVFLRLQPGGFLPVNTPVQNGQKMKIAGLDVQFFTKGSSDTTDCMTIWIPSKKVVMANFLWPMMPNIYTPRGTDFRDPRNWIEGIDIIQELEPEIMINQHTRAYVGKGLIAERLGNYEDFLRLVLDQTLRGMLQGKSADDLRDFVRLPKHLANTPNLAQTYGTLTWYPPFIAQTAVGWWDGDASTLMTLPPKAKAERLVPALGGRDKILKLAKEAYADKEYQWSLELLNYILALGKEDDEVMKLKGEIMTTMSYTQTSSIARAYLLTQGRAIAGKGPQPKNVPPQLAELQADCNKFIDALRVRIDPALSGATNHVIAFQITNNKQPLAGLHIRRGVAEYLPDVSRYKHPVQTTLSMDMETYIALFINPKGAGQLIESGKIKAEGNGSEAAKILGRFDAL